MPDNSSAVIVRLPPLTALRAFYALGETGSIRAAGDVLHVSHSAVSRHVRNLEVHLGVKLVRASGRGVSLTNEGRRYHATIVEHFTGIADATARVARRSNSLSIRCVPGLAGLRLIGRFPALKQMLPGWELSLQPMITGQIINVGSLDVAVIYCERLICDDTFRGDLLAQPRIFPVISSALHDRQRKPLSIDAVLKLPILHDDATEMWNYWLQGLNRQLSRPGMFLGNQQLAIEAAKLGQGAAIGNELLVERELRDGTLVEPVSSCIRPKGYYVVTQASRWDEPSIRKIRKWLSDACVIESDQNRS